MKQETPRLSQDRLLTRMIVLLRRRETNNFDHDRFDATGVSEDQFDATDKKNELLYALENFDALMRAQDVLEDDASCALFEDLIEYRLVGHHHKRLPTSSAYWEAREKALALKWEPSVLGNDSRFSLIGHALECVHIPYRGRVLMLECPGLAARISS